MVASAQIALRSNTTFPTFINFHSPTIHSPPSIPSPTKKVLTELFQSSIATCNKTPNSRTSLDDIVTLEVEDEAQLWLHSWRIPGYSGCEMRYATFRFFSSLEPPRGIRLDESGRCIGSCKRLHTNARAGASGLLPGPTHQQKEPSQPLRGRTPLADGQIAQSIKT